MKIKTIGIIGYGDFGRFLHLLAQKYLPHCEVRIFSSRRNPDDVTFFNFEEVCTTDVLLLCVPIHAFAETIDRILPHVGTHTIVCDVATVKKHTTEILRAKNVPHFVATHPMFGPYSYQKHGESLRGLRMALCAASIPRDQLEEVISMFKELGMSILELTPDEHDKLIAETLFLTHLVGQTVHQAGFERTTIDTVSFGYLMDAVESVAHDDALFHDVYHYNPYCAEVVARFEGVQKQIVQSLEARNSLSV